MHHWALGHVPTDRVCTLSSVHVVVRSPRKCTTLQDSIYYLACLVAIVHVLKNIVGQQRLFSGTLCDTGLQNVCKYHAVWYTFDKSVSQSVPLHMCKLMSVFAYCLHTTNYKVEGEMW